MKIHAMNPWEMTTEFSKSTNGTKPYPHGLKMYRGAYSPNTKLYFPSNEVWFFSFMTVKKRYIMFLFHQTVYKVVIMRDHMDI